MAFFNKLETGVGWGAELGWSIIALAIGAAICAFPLWLAWNLIIEPLSFGLFRDITYKEAMLAVVAIGIVYAVWNQVAKFKVAKAEK